MATFKVKDKLTSLIHFADIFNEPVYLNMKGSRRLSSSLGSLLSAALIIFLLSQGIMQSVSMFQRDDAKIYQINELEDDPTSVKINSTNNFMFALQLSKYSNPLNISEGVPFSFSATFNQYIRFADGSRIKYKNKIYMAPCNASDFPENIYGKGVYELYNLQFAYCPKYVDYRLSNGTCFANITVDYPDCHTPLQYDVKGSYLSLDFEFLQLNLQACTAKDAQNWGWKCAPSATIQSLINHNEYKFNLLYANNVINPVYYEYPNKTYIETLFWELNPQLSKTADIFLDKVIVQDYDSLWSTDAYQNRTFYSIQPSSMRELNVLQTTSGTTLLQWNIRRSSVSVVTTRTYTKITDVMTNLGGFAQAVMFIAAFLAMGYVEYKYQMTLSNEFYDFHLPDDPQAKPKKTPGKRKNDYVEHVGSPLQSPKSPIIEPEDKDEKEGKEKLDSIEKVVDDYKAKKAKRKPIDFTLWEYAKMIGRFVTCRRNNRDNVAEKARDLVEEELDIIRVIQKLKEIDKLKVLLLNRYQREVFNFIEKPLVTLDNDQPIQLDNVLPDLSFELEDTKDDDTNQPNQNLLLFNSREEFDNSSKYSKLYMAYRYLIEDQQPEHEGYNRKLLDMIGEDLIKVFERVDLLIEDNPDPRHFEEIIKSVFDRPGALNDEPLPQN